MSPRYSKEVTIEHQWIALTFKPIVTLTLLSCGLNSLLNFIWLYSLRISIDFSQFFSSSIHAQNRCSYTHMHTHTSNNMILLVTWYTFTRAPGSPWCLTPPHRYAHSYMDSYTSTPVYTYLYHLAYPYMDICIYLHIHTYILLMIYLGVHSDTYLHIDTPRPYIPVHLYISTIIVNSQLYTHIYTYTHASNPLYVFTNSSAGAGYDTRSIFKWSLTGLNSEFVFSCTGCLTKAEELSLPYYSPHNWRENNWIYIFSKVLSAMGNAISLVQNLNSCHCVHFIWQ